MKKISLVTSQGKKQMCCAELIVLSESQYDKLTDDYFAKRIDAIAKDLHIDWAIDVTSNANVLNITRTTANVIDDAFYHDLEIASTNFMSAIDKLEYDKQNLDECPSHEKVNEEEEETIDFVKTLLEKAVPNERTRINLMEMIVPGLYAPAESISRALLGEMCELYLAKHDKS